MSCFQAIIAAVLLTTASPGEVVPSFEDIRRDVIASASSDRITYIQVKVTRRTEDRSGRTPLNFDKRIRRWIHGDKFRQDEILLNDIGEPQSSQPYTESYCVNGVIQGRTVHHIRDKTPVMLHNNDSKFVTATKLLSPPDFRVLGYQYGAMFTWADQGLEGFFKELNGVQLVQYDTPVYDAKTNSYLIHGLGPQRNTEINFRVRRDCSMRIDYVKMQPIGATETPTLTIETELELTERGRYFPKRCRHTYVQHDKSYVRSETFEVERVEFLRSFDDSVFQFSDMQLPIGIHLLDKDDPAQKHLHWNGTSFQKNPPSFDHVRPPTTDVVKAAPQAVPVGQIDSRNGWIIYPIAIAMIAIGLLIWRYKRK
jgi:hypothetical protein